MMKAIKVTAATLIEPEKRQERPTAPTRAQHRQSTVGVSQFRKTPACLTRFATARFSRLPLTTSQLIRVPAKNQCLLEPEIALIAGND
jgi:hypothetical protein